VGIIRMNVRRAFTFVFHDQQWTRKFGLAVLLSVTASMLGVWSLLRDVGVVPGPALLSSPLFAPVSSLAFIPFNGFLLRITREVVAGSDVPLPAWSRIRGILRDGGKLWTLVTVWSLPGITARLMVGNAGRVSGEQGSGLDTLISLGENAILFVEPAAVAWLATTGSLAAGLNVRAVLATVRHNVGGYILVFLVTIGVFLLSVGLSAILLWLAWQGTGRALTQAAMPTFFAISVGIALLVFAPYLRCVEHHLYGQAFVEASHRTLALRERPRQRTWRWS
jgi:hypothetical protein